MNLTLEAVLCMGVSTNTQVWIVLPEYCEQFSVWGVPIPNKIMECTTRTPWIASTGFRTLTE